MDIEKFQKLVIKNKDFNTANEYNKLLKRMSKRDKDFNKLMIGGGSLWESFQNWRRGRQVDQIAERSPRFENPSENPSENQLLSFSDFVPHLQGRNDNFSKQKVKPLKNPSIIEIKISNKKKKINDVTKAIENLFILKEKQYSKLTPEDKKNRDTRYVSLLNEKITLLNSLGDLRFDLRLENLRLENHNHLNEEETMDLNKTKLELCQRTIGSGGDLRRWESWLMDEMLKLLRLYPNLLPIEQNCNKITNMVTLLELIKKKMKSDGNVSDNVNIRSFNKFKKIYYENPNSFNSTEQLGPILNKYELIGM